MRQRFWCALVLIGSCLLGSHLLAADTAKAKAKAAPAKVAVIVPPKHGVTETIKLFNGKDLTGWKGYSDHWSVEDGDIVGKSNKPVPVSTYLVSDRKFTDFRLIAKVKLVKSEMHSGIAFWGKVGPDVVPEKQRHGRAQYTYGGTLVMFPSAWGMHDLFGRGGLPVDGKPAQKVGHQHDWNDLEILAQGNRVRVAANGVAVVDYVEPDLKRIHEAPLGLQLHSNNQPEEVRFKDLVIETFPKENHLVTVKGGK